MTVSQAIDAARMIVTAYPNGGRDADKHYIGALAGILRQYPKAVASACADPLHGVITGCNFLPTVKNLIEWCDKSREPWLRTLEREKRIAEQRALRDETERKRQRLLASRVSTP